jgi:3-hydroxybutyryl-CoA dehydrogenase
MKILVVAEKKSQEEFKIKFNNKENFDVEYIDDTKSISPTYIQNFEIIFDCSSSLSENKIKIYAELANRIIVLNGVFGSLHSFQKEIKKSNSIFLMMNLLPTFINKPMAECAILMNEKKSFIENIFQKLDWKISWVENRIGLVSPRVISMIINEAFFTLQEKTANKKDIDLAMKLGTNYPFGPFEWLEQIGVKNVYLLLEAMYADTHDERYKICPLLKTEYLNSI